MNCTIYRYYHGNYLGTLNFIWRRPEAIENIDRTKESQALLQVYEQIPRFSTRQMRKNVIDKV